MNPRVKNSIKSKSLVVVLLSAFSCFQVDTETYVRYDIYNDSGVDVTLVFMDMYILSSVNTEFRTVMLANNQIWSYEMGPRASNLYALGGEVDSAYVIFDTSDKIVYIRGDGKPRNILETSSYSGGITSSSKFGETFKYTYVITEEDYQNALDSN